MCGLISSYFCGSSGGYCETVNLHVPVYCISLPRPSATTPINEPSALGEDAQFETRMGLALHFQGLCAVLDRLILML